MRARLATAIGILTLCLSGCSLFTDRTKSIAALTLTNEHGGFDQATYNAAIQARYPSGTPLQKVLSYVDEAGGKCGDRDGRLWCEIPVRSSFCAAHLLGLDVGSAGDRVTDIKVHVGGLSC